MLKIGRHLVIPLMLVCGTSAPAPHFAPFLASRALASPAGDACRKEICEGAMAACLRADLRLNPLASTEAEKKGYCSQFFTGCMSRSISPDQPWYSPETVARLLKCPA